MRTVTLARADDWCWLFVDGTLYFEGHSVPDFVWIDLLAEFGTKTWSGEVDPSCIERLEPRGAAREEDVVWL